MKNEQILKTLKQISQQINDLKTKLNKVENRLSAIEKKRDSSVSFESTELPIYLKDT